MLSLLHFYTTPNEYSLLNLWILSSPLWKPQTSRAIYVLAKVTTFYYTVRIVQQNLFQNLTRYNLIKSKQTKASVGSVTFLE